MSMIFEPVVNALQGIDGLTGVYPAGHIIDSEGAPFVCYSFGQRDAVRDLLGNVHHYEDNVTITIFSETYDEAWAIEAEIEDIFNDWIQYEYSDLRIFSADVTIKGDAVLSGIDLITRSMIVAIDWARM